LDIKSLFYGRYLKEKLSDNEMYFSKDKWRDYKFNIFFKVELLSDIKILFIKSSEEYNDKYNFKNELFILKESLKFKINGVKLRHKFEVFNTRYSTSFFSVISKFHLPCVRGYYDGNNVYLLPSCISAANTLINLDYKYFAGTNDPIEIINKYRMRGYSTLLNDSEKIKFIKYILGVERMSLMYNNPNIKKQKDIDSILGYFEINDIFFNPRDILYKYYLMNKPVDLNYNIVAINSKWRYDYDQIYVEKGIVNNNLIKLVNLDFIDKHGYIKPVRKWYFDAIFDNIY
jgi:hypothetical protein